MALVLQRMLALTAAIRASLLLRNSPRLTPTSHLHVLHVSQGIAADIIILCATTEGRGFTFLRLLRMLRMLR